MGASWNERQREGEGHGIDLHGSPPVHPALEAAELDLLRRAPDFDAEEMASVRPSGGWPTVQAAPVSAPAPPAAKLTPPWLPPNRVEPPVKIPAPVAVGPAAPARPGGAQFPEERTLALIAEDLLGRPLDEPAPPLPSAACPAGYAAPAHGAEWAAGSGTEIWDAAMPLVAEG